MATATLDSGPGLRATAVVPAQNTLQLVAPSPRVTGSVMRAPLGSPLPTSSYAPVDPSYVDLGYTDENGLKQKENRTNTDQFAWGGDLVGTLQEKYSRDQTFTLLQFINSDVLSTAYGINNTTVIPATGVEGTEIAVKMNANLLDTLQWVFDGFYLNRLVRIVLPIARVTQIGDVDLTHKAYTKVQCTLKAYPDANKNHGYLYVNQGLAGGS